MALVCAALMAMSTGAFSVETGPLSKPLTEKGLSKKARIKKANDGAVGIVAGAAGGTAIQLASDLSNVLDGEDLRIVPMAGKGAIQNITDLLYLRGVDIAIVQSDVLNYIRTHKLHDAIDDKISYVTKLHNEEFHLLARAGIDSIEALNGKTVNFGAPGSGSYMTAGTVFEALGIKVQAATLDNQAALHKLKIGELDAMVVVAGRPAPLILNIKPGDGLKLLPVAFTGKLSQTYLPAQLTSEDYAGLIAKANTVETIAAGTVMAVFNWRRGAGRYYRVHKFINAFFDGFSRFQDGSRHAKWREVNLNARVAGWQRYRSATEWLDKAAERQRAARRARADTHELQAAFRAFLESSNIEPAANISNEDELFSRFLEWRRANP